MTPDLTTEGPRSITDGSGAMFDQIAARYDFMNRVISLGIDQSWRKKTARALALSAGARVLDLATGTADLAIQVARACPSATVLGLDPSPRMLEIGRAKLQRAGLSERVELGPGDAQNLDLSDRSFDGVCIAFGIRNVPDRRRALSEMARVTKVGGRVAILELSEPTDGILSPIARFHVHRVVPYLGALLSGTRQYRYLQSSIEAFPPAHEFVQILGEVGLQVLEARALTFGACHLYVGTPREAS